MRRVTVCGKPWTIVSARQTDEDQVLGECLSPPRRLIRIFLTGDRATDRDTLIHELIHAVEYERRMDIGHGMVRAIAAAVAGSRA
jgi:hypothetical protein